LVPRKKPGSERDPRQADEAARYDNPIASREFILATLDMAGVPLTLDELAEQLDLEAEDRREALRRRLRAMERDGQLMCNRRGAYGAVSRMDLVRGTVQASREGYGFLVPAEGGEDLYLHGRQMRQVFHGDEVLARASGTDQRGRREGTIVEVLKRNTELMVGRIRLAQGVNYVVAENPRIQHEVLVRDADCGDAREGQYVTVQILTQPASRCTANRARGRGAGRSHGARHGDRRLAAHVRHPLHLAAGGGATRRRASRPEPTAWRQGEDASTCAPCPS
jgi:ribonuclease R